MLEGVRESFLHDPVGRKVQCRRKVHVITLDAQPNVKTGRADVNEERVDVTQSGMGHQFELVSVATHRIEQAAHLRERGAARVLYVL